MTNYFISIGFYASIDSEYANEDLKNDDVRRLSLVRKMQGDDSRLEGKMMQKDPTQRALKGGGGATTTATGATGSIVSTSSYASNECQPSANESAGLYQLEPRHLTMPLVIAIGSAALGLLAFFIKMWKTRNKVEHLKAMNSVSKDGVLCGRNDTALYARVSQIEDEDLLIRSMIKGMSPAEMWEELKRMNVDQSDIEEALDALPDSQGLVDLLLREKLSPLAKEFQAIRSLPVSDLCNILISTSPSTSNDQSWKALLNDEDDPQGKLAEKVIQEPLTRYVATTRARFVQTESEGRVSESVCVTNTAESSGLNSDATRQAAVVSSLEPEISVSPLLTTYEQGCTRSAPQGLPSTRNVTVEKENGS
mmetsp:Transcript_7548/g.11111  ORF Transcript_7548/g.11111 Transcript_7548/m.11111 type:complete len:365 (-) Transcript_7548:70-1164(-)